jgi:hypothetical protein
MNVRVEIQDSPERRDVLDEGAEVRRTLLQEFESQIAGTKSNYESQKTIGLLDSGWLC